MMIKTPLCELAIKYGSDRTPYTGGHAYTPYYYDLLKNRSPKKILEIGIDTGRGLRMWKEYFPLAEIFGLDGNRDLLFNEDRIKTFFCDLGSLESIQNAAIQVGGDIDIVFDDGSHIPQHQVETAKIFIPLLATDGIYIIEDVGFPVPVEAGLPYDCEVVEFKVNKLSLDDDRLVVIHATV